MTAPRRTSAAATTATAAVGAAAVVLLVLSAAPAARAGTSADNASGIGAEVPTTTIISIGILAVLIVIVLVATGGENVEAAGMPWARVRAAVAGVLGAPDEGPFDRILVSAMATRLPSQLV